MTETVQGCVPVDPAAGDLPRYPTQDCPLAVHLVAPAVASGAREGGRLLWTHLTVRPFQRSQSDSLAKIVCVIVYKLKPGLRKWPF